MTPMWYIGSTTRRKGTKMYEALTAKERKTLRLKMDAAWDDITRLIRWAQSTKNGIHTDELLAMQDMRTEILYAAWEAPTRLRPVHDFTDDGTDPGNCSVCHTYHTTPRHADGTLADVPL